jgi:probable rRNA maturation factor
LNKQSIQLRHRRILRTFIESIFKKEGQQLTSLNIIFCNDSDLLSLNKKYLHHAYSTDVLTFDLSSSKSIDGEIYLSVFQVKQNAVIYDISIWEEIHRVMFHGILHLCGYDDSYKSAKTRMEKKQDHYLNLYKNLMQETVSRGTIKKGVHRFI